MVIVTGPTASGKTGLAERLKEKLCGEIINADIGQFYTPLTVGTAKPVGVNRGLFFDILDNPLLYSAAQFRADFIQVFPALQKESKIPLVVGGSMFYLRALLFSFLNNCSDPITKTNFEIDELESSEVLYSQLASIDPVRAGQIHKNDKYRILRALQLFQTTGKKPSEQQMFWAPVASKILVVCIDPKRDVIRERIRLRLELMIDDWIVEARSLIGTEWEAFLAKKNIIGYTELIEWLKTTPNQKQDLEKVKEKIFQKTSQYSKRQSCFWRFLKKDLNQRSDIITVVEVLDANEIE